MRQVEDTSTGVPKARAANLGDAVLIENPALPRASPVLARDQQIAGHTGRIRDGPAQRQGAERPLGKLHQEIGAKTPLHPGVLAPPLPPAADGLFFALNFGNIQGFGGGLTHWRRYCGDRHCEMVQPD